MRHARPLAFEGLEARKLLSRAHPAAARPAAAEKTPMVLDGTLAVDNKAASTSTDAEGDTTTAIPVAGTINGLGEVHGVWDETDDAYGDYLGPDTIQLRDAQGAIAVSFNAGTLGKPHRGANKTVYYQLPQRLTAGQGAYAHDTETGTIQLDMNAARNAVASLTLATGKS